MISLTQFCKENNLAKTTVYRDCQRLGIETSNGLDTEALEKLKSEYGLPDPVEAEIELLPKEAPPKVSIETGNHRKEVRLAVRNTSVNLGEFRTTRERSTLAARKTCISSLVNVLDQIEEGFDQAEQEQELELQEIRQIKRQGLKRIEQFRRRADEYRIKSDILASIQNAELDELEDITDEVNGLGKPSTGSSGSGSD